MTITGKTLIAWGYKPGPWFTNALTAVNEAEAKGAATEQLRAMIAAIAPPEPTVLPLGDGAPVRALIEAETEDEAENVGRVQETMQALVRTPTVTAGAIMPDACPTGRVGTIPVGGIAKTDGAIHPGMHSADICCSLAISVLGDVDPKRVLDAGQAVTHFGPVGRAEGHRITPPADVMAAFAANPILAENQKIRWTSVSHFGTQGDGNHFLFVGRLASTGETALVTHHGSRAPGAHLYKEGMTIAERFRRSLSPETLKQNAWIPFDTPEGAAYWDALQAIRLWTRESHWAIHDRTAEAIGAPVQDRFWNEHNFVFRRGDSFLHAKGATPAWHDFAPDSSGLVMIPLNMAEPVLIVRGRDNPEALGFCPHGAGRNISRTAHRARIGDEAPATRVTSETEGLDVRFWSGEPDLGELPSAYKRAGPVVAQIEQFGLAEIVDRVEPYGCIMAGHITDFRARRKRKKSRR